MRKTRDITMLAGLAAAFLTGIAVAQEKPERGKDRIDVPAMEKGLWVHPMFQSNMVIQRDKPIRVRGWADPGEKVTVTFGGQSRSAIAAADRSWVAELPAMPASSEPRQMVVQGKSRKVELENLLVGDVWLLGGQSNMEFPVEKVDNGDLEIVGANFPKIRLMTVPQQNGPEAKASFPSWYQWNDFFSGHFRQGFWDICSPGSARDMSGIGYVFARRIHMATQVPIGIIDVSRGGTCLETWTPLELLKSIQTPEVKAKLAEWDQKVAGFNPQKDLADRVSRFNQRVAQMKEKGQDVSSLKAPTDLQSGPALDMNRPGNCYASMIAPIAGFAVKGAIWHQGYNNALDPNGHVLYDQVFTPMIKAWRTAFNDPNMPFGIISQETDGEPQDLENFLSKMPDEGTYIREAHYKTFLNLRNAGDKNIGFASSFDQRRSWYHPQIKIPVGERMARWALATQYGMKQIRWLPPTIKETRVGNGRMVIVLDDAVAPYHDGPIQGFAIAGKDGRFQPAQAQWLDKNEGKPGPPNHDKSTIILTSSLVPEPVYYRYAWCRNPLANLKSSDHTDIPLETQRNDTWDLAGMYEIYTGRKPKTPGSLDRGEHAELAKALKADDLKRRIEEAKVLLNANGFKTDSH